MKGGMLQHLDGVLQQRLKRVPDSGRLLAPKPAAPPSCSTQVAAWGIVILFLTVPVLALAGDRSRVLWAVWAIISLWAGLDSYTIGAALSIRSKRSKGPLMLGLALFNLLTALGTIAKPFVTRQSRLIPIFLLSER